jgi:hypothetical protein
MGFEEICVVYWQPHLKTGFDPQRLKDDYLPDGVYRAFE